jgi:hypothetical protein
MKVGTFKRKDRHASEYRINIYRCDVTGDTPESLEQFSLATAA